MWMSSQRYKAVEDRNSVLQTKLQNYFYSGDVYSNIPILNDQEKLQITVYDTNNDNNGNQLK